MKHRPGNLLWVLLAILLLAGWLMLLRLPPSNGAASRALAETRQSLREQGFKTDLADFDLSTTPELRTREAVLKNTATNSFSRSFPVNLNLLPPVGNDSAMVVWKLASLPGRNRSSYDDNDQLSWDEFRNAINQKQSLFDSACAAILSGPIQFNLDASRGSAMLLPHLAVMKNLTQTFGDRTVLALHDGNPSGAWTNLLAATRLVTAYEPEPVEISHLVRLNDMTLAFNITWQALQTNGWTDDQLARLQQEWESANFFTNLPETAAFQRASAVAMCESERQRSMNDNFTFIEFCKAALQNPMQIWWKLNYNWNQLAYRQHGSLDDQQALLLFYHDREVELRNAIQATNWSQMRSLPGVTNRIFFRSKYSSPISGHDELARNEHGLHEIQFQLPWACCRGRSATANHHHRPRARKVSRKIWRLSGNARRTHAGISQDAAAGLHGRPAAALPARQMMDIFFFIPSGWMAWMTAGYCHHTNGRPNFAAAAHFMKHRHKPTSSGRCRPAKLPSKI